MTPAQRRVALAILKENCAPEDLRCTWEHGPGCLLERLGRQGINLWGTGLSHPNDRFVASGSLTDFDALVWTVKHIL